MTTPLTRALWQEYYIHLELVDRLISENHVKIEEIGKSISCFLHVYYANDLSIRYLNPKEADWIGLSPGEVKNMGKIFIKRYFHPETILNMLPRLRRLTEEEDHSGVYADFLQMWDVRQQKYTWLFSATKLLSNSQDLITICHLINHDTPALSTKLDRMQDEMKFVRQHHEFFKTLTRREKQIMRLVALGYSNPNISARLFISRNTVEQHRKNINRKLAVNSIVDLIRYAQAFDLV